MPTGRDSVTRVNIQMIVVGVGTLIDGSAAGEGSKGREGPYVPLVLFFDQ